MKLDYCFHSHTYRCGHATGTDEMYVQEAIKAGVKHLGFSDHVFLPGKTHPGMRGDYSQLTDYINSVRNLSLKYKNDIEIFLAFECEYFDEFVDYYRDLKNKHGFDYLILGQHFFLDELGNFFYVRNDASMENVERYMTAAKKAMESGLFLYFAHPDLILTIFNEFDEQAEKVSRRLCELAKEYDMPLELNLNGMTWTLPNHISYPCEKFWEVVGQVGNKVVIGYDAHKPEFYRETKYLDRASEWVEKYHLNVINSKEIIKRIKKR